MAIGTAPQQEPIAGERVSPVWVGWFQKVATALFGWRETRYHTFTVSLTGVPTYNVTIDGLRFGDIPLITPKNGYPGGLIYTAYVSADNVITIQAHDFGLGIGTFDADFYMITFRQ